MLDNSVATLHLSNYQLIAGWSSDSGGPPSYSGYHKWRINIQCCYCFGCIEQIPANISLHVYKKNHREANKSIRRPGPSLSGPKDSANIRDFWQFQNRNNAHMVNLLQEGNN